MMGLTDNTVFSQHPPNAHRSRADVRPPKFTHTTRVLSAVTWRHQVTANQSFGGGNGDCGGRKSQKRFSKVTHRTRLSSGNQLCRSAGEWPAKVSACTTQADLATVTRPPDSTRKSYGSA